MNKMFQLSVEELRWMLPRVAIYTAAVVATTQVFNFAVTQVTRLVKRSTDSV